MQVVQAYRFALDPTPVKERACRSHVGARRFAYNWGLAVVKARLDAKQRGEDVRIPSTLPALRRAWNRDKVHVAPWWRENSKEAYSSGLDGLARALENYWDSKVGTRKGRRVGFPRFRKKNGDRQSVRFTTGGIRVYDRTHVVLPRIGRIRTHEPTTKLLDLLAVARARILSATLSYEGSRWYVSFTCYVEREARRPAYPESIIGVDAGIRHLAVLSSGEAVANPRPLEKAIRTIARLHRALTRRQPGSRRRWLTRRKLARAYARAGHIRRDAMHKLTSRLARTHGTIVVERLHIAGMLRNRRLARAIADAGLSALRRQLSYKCSWNGSTLIEAHRFYPSSKTCARCGAVKATLLLSARVFRCEHCDLVVDRDLNAARNLAALAAAVAGSGPETPYARRRDVSPGKIGQTRRKREAGSGSPHQTGTAVPQGPAA